MIAFGIGDWGAGFVVVDEDILLSNFVIFRGRVEIVDDRFEASAQIVSKTSWYFRSSEGCR